MTAPPMIPNPTSPAPSGALSSQGVQDPTDPNAAVMRELFGPEAQVGEQGDPEKANKITAPNEPEDIDTTEPLDRLTQLMAALYGSDFPLIRAVNLFQSEAPEDVMARGLVPNQMPPLDELLKNCRPEEWVSWGRGRWALHGPAVELHLWLIARNRLFRSGQQWVSSRGTGGSWREPNRPTEQARVTHNLIGPALDQRCQVVTDQRPGFQVDPTSMSPDEKRKAEGRQQALEFQYDQQSMEGQTHEASYWAQTDGVAFWEVYWDRDAGPWDERMGSMPDQKKPLGDLKTKTRRVEQVRVSANATATEAPYYAIVRDVIAETESAYLYGAAGVQHRATTGDPAGNNDTAGTGTDGVLPSWVLSQTIPGEGNRLRNVKTAERFTIYVDRHPDVLPDGLQLVTVGDAVVWGPGELLFGTIPIIPVRDGSTDPSYFPRPIVEQWIPPQQRINAALSLWVNSVRVNSGGRFLAKPDAISRETFVGSGCSILEVECSGPLGEAIQPVNGFLVGQDVKDLIAFDVKAFEDMSGYNDVSRGQVSGETATAVATANEQLQRVFAPPVEAVASAFQQWAEVNLAGMAWGYDIPRDVGSVGTDRPDLARALSAKDFDGPSTVKVEGAKMMPMPAFYRKQVLDDLVNRGLITPQQYMRNSMFGNFKNLGSPDEDQEARAKRVADALRMGQQLPQAAPQAPPPNPTDPNDAQVQAQAQQAIAEAQAQPLAIRWQTNEAIEQDVLEREILLQDDLPPQVIMAAGQRWTALAAQAQLKTGTAQPNTPDATFQQFVGDALNKTMGAASSFVAKEVGASLGVAPPAFAGPSAPPGASGPSHPPGAPHGSMHDPMHGPMQDHQPHPSSPPANPSSPAAPSAPSQAGVPQTGSLGAGPPMVMGAQ